MDLYIYNLDEYTPDSRQGNEFAPSWPFRLAVAGSSDSGKTTMIINLIMGDKKANENGNRYILCDAVVLIARYPDEPKWTLVQDFFEEEDLSFTTYSSDEIPEIESFNPENATVVIFEDLIGSPKKLQDTIAGYFTHGRHRNISCIYVSQRFFAIPKIIRENVNYISLHGGYGSLSDTKRIIRLYTEESESLAPVIDDLTLRREFIVFDLRRSKSDPLSIRVRWDTSLKSVIDQSKIDLRSNSDQSKINMESITDQHKINSRFTPYGQKAVAEAKKNGWLLAFAQNFPTPAERKLLLIDGSKVKNSGIWARYVFREAYGVNGRTLGPEWKKFLTDKSIKQGYEEEQKEDWEDQKDRLVKEESVKELFIRYKNLLSIRPLDNKKIVTGIELLLQIFKALAREGNMDQQALQMGIRNLFP